MFSSLPPEALPCELGSRLWKNWLLSAVLSQYWGGGGGGVYFFSLNSDWGIDLGSVIFSSFL